jgi:methylase of polypeptide subunit release factors
MTDRLLEIGNSRCAARYRLSEARLSGSWDTPQCAEPLIHRIHAYPAKFPAFLTTKALAYARSNGVKVERVADVFCGCGTVAHEAAREGLEFWGCDINPVATLIAKVKSSDYDPERLRLYAQRILANFSDVDDRVKLSDEASGRLHYWFENRQYSDLARLLNAINQTVPERSKYREAFHCVFSAILKPTSRWKQRSTKPARDCSKRCPEVLPTFEKQCDLMVKAWNEGRHTGALNSQVHNANVMSVRPPTKPVDLIISSPPYVTSYEYADLHQLSSLWLGFASDYRSLRKGSIGSTQHDLDFRREFRRLNEVGMQVVFSLYDKNHATARSVANYYLDMQHVAKRCYEFLRDRGIAFFVIGNTEYSGVRVDNASHLAEALFDAGFARVRAAKRRISNKAHTPFRHRNGRFSSIRSQKEIYAEEFILVAHR